MTSIQDVRRRSESGAKKGRGESQEVADEAPVLPVSSNLSHRPALRAASSFTSNVATPAPRPKLKLWKHQEQVLRFVWNRQGAALFVQWRLGKTRCVIEEARFKKYSLFVVCPTSVKTIWEDDEAPRWGFPADDLYVIGYEGLRSGKGKAGFNAKAQAWLEAREGTKIMFVLDESTKIRAVRHPRRGGFNVTTMACMAVARWGAENAKDPLLRILSANPIPNGWHEIFPQACWLAIGDAYVRGLAATDDDGNPFWEWEDFRDAFLVMELESGRYSDGKHWEIKGVKRKEVLLDLLSKFAIWIERKDVLELPKDSDLMRGVVLGAKTMVEYQSMHDIGIAEVGGEKVVTQNAMARMMTEHQMTGGFLKGHTFGKPEKLEALVELLEEIGSKVIVWSGFVAEQHSIVDYLRKRKFRVTTAFAAHTKQQKRERRRNIKAWKREGGPQVLVASIKAMKFGWDGSCATAAVFYSMPWSFEDYEQAKERTAASNPKDKAKRTYVHLIAAGTVDEVILRRLREHLSDKETMSAWLKIKGG